MDSDFSSEIKISDYVNATTKMSIFLFGIWFFTGPVISSGWAIALSQWQLLFRAYVIIFILVYIGLFLIVQLAKWFGKKGES